MTVLSPASSVAPRSVSVLGSTGSVGTQTLDLLEAAGPGRFEVAALVGGRRAGLLAQQARRHQARLAVIADPAGWRELSEALAGSGIEAAAGPQAVIEAASRAADWTMAAITGAAGLHATLAAVARGKTVALANKEALVCAGAVMLAAVAAHGATLLPVDSEHNAIFQALAERNRRRRGADRAHRFGRPIPHGLAWMRCGAPTPEAALRHPVWSMGAKISIDSAPP